MCSEGALLDACTPRLARHTATDIEAHEAQHGVLRPRPASQETLQQHFLPARAPRHGRHFALHAQLMRAGSRENCPRPGAPLTPMRHRALSPSSSSQASGGGGKRRRRANLGRHAREHPRLRIRRRLPRGPRTHPSIILARAPFPTASRGVCASSSKKAPHLYSQCSSRGASCARARGRTQLAAATTSKRRGRAIWVSAIARARAYLHTRGSLAIVRFLVENVLMDAEARQQVSELLAGRPAIY